ncbi:hypothetical protein HPB51_006917 [Rhipicephalus microplus]|uniref:Uncharacterized protein n=1 Tax=Rhipicephalus microplus TaxID=6941 RepID=A0A9J6EYW3_RHIMP|nr:hypothetical protein HPB51_006917 [Rhipicephalus microplus]
MDASATFSDALCTGEQQPRSIVNGGDKTATDAVVIAGHRVKVAAGNVDANVEDAQLEQQQNDRRSAGSMRSSCEDCSCSDESSTDEEALRAEDHLRPSLCIDDSSCYPDDKSSGAVRKHYPVKPRQAPSDILKFETIHEMTRTFVRQFTTFHVERECDAHGVYVCVACSSAQRTLAKIREAIGGNNKKGLRKALSNTTFLKLLVQLCKLDSQDATRICTVSSREMRAYYESAASSEIIGTASLLEDEQSQKLWKCFFGAAAGTIKKITYTVKLWRNHRTDHAGYDGVDDFMETATKCGRQALDSNAGRPTQANSLIIADYLDARHVMVYESLKVKEDAAAIDVFLAQFNQPLLNREPRREPPNIGDVAGLVLSSECIQRVLVVKVIKDVASVWSMDHGHFHNVGWEDLINVAPSLRSLPPTVALAVLQDVEAVPLPKLLRECVKVLRVVADHGTHEGTIDTIIVTKLTAFGIGDVLSDLLFCSDYVTRMTAAKCLMKICCRQNGRQAVARAAYVKKALLRLDFTCSHFPVGDDSSTAKVTKEMRALLNLLQFMLFRNEQLRLELAETDLLAVVVRLHKSLPPTCTVLQDVKRCLRAILGVPPGHNSPQRQRQNHQQQRQPENCNSQQCYGGSRQNQVTSSKAHRCPQRVHDRETAPPAQVKLVAMTPKMLKKTTALSSYPMRESLPSAEAAEAESRPLPTEIPKPMANVVPFSACKAGAAATAVPYGRFYIRGTLVPLCSDDSHELRSVGSLKNASARTLANVACSFLNTWKPCSIYYGISPEGFVRGVRLNHEERDALRRGINLMVGSLRPQLTSTSFGADFVPVLQHAADKLDEAHHYVVEVWVRGVHRVVHTTSDGDCYLREGHKSYRAGTYDVRTWIVQVEEEHYLHAKNRGSLKEGDSPAVEDAPRPWDDVVA